MMGASTLLHHPSQEGEQAVAELEDHHQMQQASSQSWEIPELPADSSFINGVASRDVIVNESRSVWLRLFLPESAVASSPQKKKLPILIHVHGGGFVRFSAATASYHDFCQKVAIDATVLVVSLNHRLAPEHRLPAAYEDLLESLKWLQEQARSGTSSDPWLASHAQFSNVILLGGSSGGNIVHHTLSGMKTSELEPLKFTGQILLQPFFGGVERTESELRLSEGPILTLSMSDQLWKLALPAGADREHPYCNPVTKLLGEKVCGGSKLPKSLVIAGGRDMLHDRQVEFASALGKAGVDVKLVEYPEATHGFVTSEGVVSYVFMDEVLEFIRSCGEQEH